MYQLKRSLWKLYSIYREFFPTWPISAGLTVYWVFVRQSKGYFLCDRLSSFRHQLLNFLDVRRKTQRWYNDGQRVWSAFIGQAGKETHLWLTVLLVIVCSRITRGCVTKSLFVCSCVTTGCLTKRLIVCSCVTIGCVTKRLFVCSCVTTGCLTQRICLLIKTAVSWAVMPSTLVETYRRFVRTFFTGCPTCRHSLENLKPRKTLMT
jgi:hypothetical protein